MNIIPVLDLRGGVVVRARMGERHRYQPIASPLSPTSDPVDVLRGLLSVHPFTTFYLADLDAIEATGGNEPVLHRLRAEFPALTLWVDNGVADVAAAKRWLDAGLGHLVIGSESQKDMALLRYLVGQDCMNQDRTDHDRIVLSLDFRGDAFQGPDEILAKPALWPRRVIVMTLARVGSGAGPDLKRLAAIQSIAGGREIYAAGGVRDAADLRALKAAGVAGALIATALHERRIVAADLMAL
jgi:HisA/HisF family protein